MNETQRKSLAKYAYDVSKIVLTVLVIGQIINPEKLRSWIFIWGAIMTINSAVIGFLLEKEVKEK